MMKKKTSKMTSKKMKTLKTKVLEKMKSLMMKMTIVQSG